MNDHSISFNYGLFLETLLDKGYEFVFFKEQKKAKHQVVMRHDIDFDCRLALQLARIERNYNICSTYFFLVANDSYNIASPSNYQAIQEISALGHQVSIHFDPTIYEDFEAGLETERAYFERLFSTQVDIISLHRPNVFFQNHNQPIADIEHTYMEKYFRQLTYFSDSTGVWRFGHPFQSAEFRDRRSMHILIHPIWWTIAGKLNTEKLVKHFHLKVGSIREHFKSNCLPFNLVAHEV